MKTQFDILVEQILEENKFDLSWFSDMQISMILNQNNIWNNQKEENLKKQESLLDSEKILLYQNFMNAKKKEYHKKTIKTINNSINTLILEKKSLDYLTLSFFATISFDNASISWLLNPTRVRACPIVNIDSESIC